VKDKFISFIKLTDTGTDDDELVHVEMLRVGKFDHPFHGELDITPELLGGIVTNFENNVLKRDVSFDWNHDQKEASAWLKDLEIVDDVLVGSVSFTKKGTESVKEDEYGYFSIEYADNYVDPETDEEFGPTLLGGALTNRPFISDLKKIEFENPDFDGKVYRLEEAKSMRKKVKREPVTTDDPAEVKKLQDENDKLKQALKDKKEELDDVDNIDGKVKKLTSTVKKMVETNKDLEKEIKTLKGDVETKDEETRKLRVESLCEKLSIDDGHHRGVIEVAKEIMLADKTGRKVVKLSETVGEGDDAVTTEYELSVTDSVLKLLEAIPDSQRTDLSEKTSIKDAKTIDDEAEDKGIKAAFERKGVKTLNEKRKAA